MKKLLAVGSQNWQDAAAIHRALDYYLADGITDLIAPLEFPHTGAAKAITDWGNKHKLHTSTWSFPHQMQNMIGEHPDQVIAFYQSAQENAEPHLDELVRRAKKKGYPIAEIYNDLIAPAVAKDTA